MRRIMLVPAVLVGCMIVVWVGSVAAANMPSEEKLTPSLTANPDHSQSVSATEIGSTLTEQHVSEKPVCTISERYPVEIQQWCVLIELSANKTGLPANLIAAVMLQESGGDPLIYSSSGAVGLMQVMPRDGLAAHFNCINGPCFASRPTIAELQEPEFNLAYGSQMLADLTAKYGNYREALFRYGPMDVGYYYADLVLNIWETYQ